MSPWAMPWSPGRKSDKVHGREAVGPWSHGAPWSGKGGGGGGGGEGGEGGHARMIRSRDARP